MSKRNRTSFTAVLRQARGVWTGHSVITAVKKESRGCTVFIWGDNGITPHRFYSYSKALEFLQGLEKEIEK